MSRAVLAVFLVAVVATVASADPFDVIVDESQSTLNMQLCISGTCSSDASSVTGYVSIDLDNYFTPESIWLHDFDLQLSNDLQWFLNWGFLGSFNANATDLSMYYAQPGTILGPETITAGAYMFVDVPLQPTGVLSYAATGIPCSVLQAADMPCNGTMNFADMGTQTADEFGGEITIEAGVATLTSTIDVISPLDPDYPELGTVHVSGTIVGHGDLPIVLCRGDANCDGLVTFDDINYFVSAVVGQADWEALFDVDPTCDYLNNDLNADELVTFDDINPFVDALVAGECYTAQ